MGHFVTAPSSSDLWTRCPDWKKMIANAPPEEDSEAAIEGRAAHSASEEAIQCGTFDVYEYVGREWHGVTVTEEMAEFCNVYTKRVKQLVDSCRALGIEVDYATETTVDLSWVFEGWFGTRDAHVIAVHGDWARIIDLKYGRVIVEPTTRQLMSYALDVVNKYPNINYVTLEIVQPRAPHRLGKIRAHTVTRAELMEYAELCREMQVKNHSPEYHGVVAGSHCTYCPALGLCLGASQYVLSTVAASSGFNPNVLDADGVEQVLLNQKLIENFLKKVHVWGMNLAKQGTPFHDMKLVKVKSKESLNKDLTVEKMTSTIKLLTGKTPDLDELAPRKIGAISKIRATYGDSVAKMMTSDSTETLALRPLSDSGAAIVYNMDDMLSAIAQPLESTE